jgi:hypothetical protein
MLTITTPAAARDFTTVEAVKRQLALQTEAEDARIAQWIEQASDAIRTWCDREFSRQTYTEKLAGHGGTLLTLARAPIVSVASVALKGEPVVDYAIEDAEAGLLFREQGWAETVALGWHLIGSPHPRGDLPHYTVLYVAGYLLPTEENSTLPRDIERGCIELVKWYRSGKAGKSGGAVSSKRVGDVSLSYFDEGAEEPQLPREVRGLLRPWRRVLP